jgi:hypothetical protein
MTPKFEAPKTPDEWMNAFNRLVINVKYHGVIESIRELDENDVAFAKLLADVPQWIRVVAGANLEADGNLKAVAEIALAAMQDGEQ